MKTERFNLMDVMAVKRDAARKAKRPAAHKVRRGESRKTSAVSKHPDRKRVTAINKSRATREPPDAATAVKAAPVKVTVKQAVLAAFYADKRKVLSTKEAISAIQANHPGMNESSIRVWISDFRKDGSITLVKKDGLQAFWKAGQPGKFALR